MKSFDLFVLVAVSLLWGTQYLMAAKALDYTTFDKLELTRTATGILQLLALLLVGCAFMPKFRAQVLDVLLATGGSSAAADSKHHRLKRILLMHRNALIVGVLCHGLGLTSLMVAENGGVSSGVQSIIFCLEPLVAALSSVLFKLPDAPRLSDVWFVVGMILSCVGVTMVMIPDIAAGGDGDGNISSHSVGMKVFYIMCAIASPSFYGFGAIVNQKTLRDVPMPTLLAITLQNIYGFLYALIQTAATGARLDFNVDWHVWMIASLMSLTSAVLAWGMFVWLLGRIGSKASLYAFLAPCVAVLAGALFNKELQGQSPGMIALKFIGMLVVFIGMGTVLRKDLLQQRRAHMASLDTKPIQVETPEEQHHMDEIIDARGI